MASTPFQPGDLIGGRYRLMRLIGHGAMGAVWSARNESTDRDFALKLMLPDAAQNPVALQRFFQEAKASGRLRHRCVVEVYDLGRIESLAGRPPDPHAGTPYIVMELLEGEPLDVMLRRQKFLPPGTALRIVSDVAKGLDVAHNQRIIHRDLKPGNLFLHRTLEGTIVPKILDFGISKLIGPSFDPVATSAGTVLGSPAYMSPEQASGELDVDGRSDVWSLGVILYKCLCGSVPFQAPNYNALMIAITRNEPQRISERVPGLPLSVEGIVHRCLAKDRNDRWPTAKALAEQIDKVLKETQLETLDLEKVVTVPAELSPDDAKTIARTMATMVEPNGTLAATELDDLAPTRAMESASHSLQMASGTPMTSAQSEPSSTAPRFFDMKKLRERRSLMAIAAAGTIVLVLGAIAIARKSPSDSSNVNTVPPLVLSVSAPETTTKPTPAAPPATTTAPAETTTTASATADAATSATTKPAATQKKWTQPPPQTTTKKPPPADTAKNVHEGVTSSGI